MSVILRGPFGPIVATLRGEPAADGRPLDLRDPIAARAWLRRLSATPGELSRLRALAGRRHAESLGRLDDDGIERLAGWLAAGEIRLTEQPAGWLMATGAIEEQEAAAAPMPAALPVAEPAEPPPEERTFDDNADEEAIAQAMREAARLGVPFCEKCTRAALAKKRAAAAAEAGA
jgi:hypothetical protein